MERKDHELWSPSVLEDIYKSLLSHLFQHGYPMDCPPQEYHSKLCLDACGELFQRLRWALGCIQSLDNPTPIPPGDKIDLETTSALVTFYDWLWDNALFKEATPKNGDRYKRYQRIRHLFEAKRYPEHLNDYKEACKQSQESTPSLLAWEEAKWEHSELIEFFSSLVNLSYVSVDTLYRQIYYADIYHPILSEEIIQTVKQQVWVPFYQGSVGVAAQVGGFSVENTFLTPNGLVAVEDLLQGSVCTMYAGVGIQDMDPQNESLQAPKPRWQFRPQNATCSPPEKVWYDELQDNLGQKCCAAVLFCSFPLARVFPATEQRDKQDNKEPSLPFTNWIPKNSLYDLFSHVGRNYERSVLLALKMSQESRRGEFLARALYRQGKQERDATLSVLASNHTKGNPIGGILAVRAPIDTPPSTKPGGAAYGLDVCVTRLERILESELVKHPAVLSQFGQTEDAVPVTTEERPLIEAIVEHLAKIEVRCTPPNGNAVSGEPVELILLLHASTPIACKDITVLQKRIAKTLERTLRFLGCIHKYYYLALEKALCDPTEPIRTSFQAGKILRDTCENICSAISQVLCIGILDNQPGATDYSFGREYSQHIENADRIISLAKRYLPCEDYSGKLYTNELKSLARCEEAEAIRPNLMGVSVYYHAPQNLEPSDDLKDMGAIRDIATWRRWTPTAKNRVRRVFIKAFMEHKINKNFPGIQVPVANMNGKLIWDLSQKNAQISFVTIKFIEHQELAGTGDKALLFKYGDSREEESSWKPIHFLASPRYRIAGLTLRKESLDSKLKSLIVNWQEPGADPLVKEILDYVGPDKDIHQSNNLVPHFNNHLEKLGVKVTAFTIRYNHTPLGQVIFNDLLKHEEAQARESNALEAEVRADIGAGMFHNLGHYILPLQGSAKIIELYLEEGKLQEAARMALKTAETIQRMARFQQAVRQHIIPNAEKNHLTLESLEELPFELLFAVTLAASRTDVALKTHPNFSKDTKFGEVLLGLRGDTYQKDIGNSTHREELVSLLKSKHWQSEDIGQRSVSNIDNLLLWWRERYGLEIEIRGSFGELHGDFSILSGVMEELLLNALMAVKNARVKLFGTNRDVDKLKPPHIVLEAIPGAIRLCNWSIEPIKESKLKQRPEKDIGWGLYAMRLLMNKIGGELTPSEMVHPDAPLPGFWWVSMQASLGGNS